MAVLDTDNMTVSAKGTLPRVPFVALKEKILGKKYELSIRFVRPTEAQALNQLHRNKTYTPNTLSFPLSKSTGEIVLCLSAIRREYKTFGMDYRTYLLFIVIHSMLHLKGYDHGSIMERKERALLSHFTEA